MAPLAIYQSYRPALEHDAANKWQNEFGTCSLISLKIHATGHLGSTVKLFVRCLVVAEKDPLCERDDYFRLLGLYIEYIEPSRSKYVSCRAHRGIDTIQSHAGTLEGQIM